MGQNRPTELWADGAKVGKWEQGKGITLEKREVKQHDEDFLELFSAPVDIKIPKDLRCTSRKRFVKLLMSCGMERNDTVKLAAMAAEFGIPYQTHLLWIGFFLGQEIQRRRSEIEPVAFEQ